MQPREQADMLVKLLDDKLAEDILCLHVAHLTIITEYFVICSGRSSTHVRALCDEVERVMRDEKTPPIRKDGLREAGWIAMDFGGVILHIFSQKEREYYNLERLWMDGQNSVQTSDGDSVPPDA